jgi:TorA maturation chaperone TorD
MSGPPSTPTRSSADDDLDGSRGAADASRSEVDLALCRSALWEALALGFRTPTDETIARLATAEGSEALAEAAAMLDASDASELVTRVRSLGMGPAPTLADLESAYARLFGHTARGRVPSYETEYGEDAPFLPQREMSDLGAFLRAFGLAVRASAHERPDHVACECEFLLVLARKEAHAIEVGDPEMLEVTLGATRAFLRDHAARWMRALGETLAREDPTGFYGRLGALGAAFVAAECRRARVPIGPEFLRLRSVEPDGSPMACGPPEDVRVP